MFLRALSEPSWCRRSRRSRCSSSSPHPARCRFFAPTTDGNIEPQRVRRSPGKQPRAAPALILQHPRNLLGISGLKARKINKNARRKEKACWTTMWAEAKQSVACRRLQTQCAALMRAVPWATLFSKRYFVFHNDLLHWRYPICNKSLLLF